MYTTPRATKKTIIEIPEAPIKKSIYHRELLKPLSLFFEDEKMEETSFQTCFIKNLAAYHARIGIIR